MIDSSLTAAIEACPPGALVPERVQARAGDLPPRGRVVDLLNLGSPANGESDFIALVQAGERLLVVPGRHGPTGVRRDPSVACRLRSGVHGAFTVEVIGPPLIDGAAEEVPVDQSNDSVILGDVMVKWQLEANPSPAPHRLRALVGAGITPEPRAIVTWQSPEGPELTVLTAAQYLPGADDGWTWAVELVRAHARGDDVDALKPFATLGGITARMHQRLAAEGVGSWSDADILALRAECDRDLDEACAEIDGREGDRLRARRTAIRGVIDSLGAVSTTPVIDIHGDLHIGQVLHAAGGSDYSIVDFDGNPVLPPLDRMARQPAARDVAGMLASIDHVARVVHHRTPGIDRPRITAWIPVAQESYLRAYREGLQASGQTHLLDDRLLPALLVDQELREFLYSTRHLPHWRYVPDAVLTDMFPEEA